MMMRSIMATAVSIMLLCSLSLAHAQKATERYIPMGQSPGLSGKYTYLGQIKDINAQETSIIIADSAQDRTVKITPRTRIWLDRTGRKMTNLNGVFADLKKGRKIELKYKDHERKLFADWVKVEVTEPGG